MTIFKPYDPAALCPKCRHDDIGTGYYKSAFDLCYTSREKMGLGIGEDRNFLVRTCRRCHYEWPEGTVEGKTKEDTAMQGSEGGKHE